MLSRKGASVESFEGSGFGEEEREEEDEEEERLHLRAGERAVTAAEEAAAGENLGREVKEEGRVVGLRRWLGAAAAKNAIVQDKEEGGGAEPMKGEKKRGEREREWGFRA